MQQYVVGNNGNWYKWDAEDADYIDTGTTASPTHPIYIPPIGSGGGSGSGTTDHTQLTNRDAPAQHPVTAISVPSEYTPSSAKDIATKEYADSLSSGSPTSPKILNAASFESTGSTSLVGMLPFGTNGAVAIACATARSTFTGPNDWTLAATSPSVTAAGAAQTGYIYYKKLDSTAPVIFTSTQATTGRMFINMLIVSSIAEVSGVSALSLVSPSNNILSFSSPANNTYVYFVHWQYPATPALAVGPRANLFILSTDPSLGQTRTVAMLDYSSIADIITVNNGRTETADGYLLAMCAVSLSA